MEAQIDRLLQRNAALERGLTQMSKYCRHRWRAGGRARCATTQRRTDAVTGT